MRRNIVALLIAIGLLFVVISFIQTAIQGSSGQGNAGFGGVILIGPIPIVFGSSPAMAIASMLMAIALIVIGLIALLWLEGNKDIDQKDQLETKGGRTKVHGGAIIMIGPIPVVIGSDYRITILIMLIALTIMIVWVLAFKI